MSREEALQEYTETKDILLLQKRLGHKYIRSTMQFLVKRGVY